MSEFGSLMVIAFAGALADKGADKDGSKDGCVDCGEAYRLLKKQNDMNPSEQGWTFEGDEKTYYPIDLPAYPKGAYGGHADSKLVQV